MESKERKVSGTASKESILNSEIAMSEWVAKEGLKTSDEDAGKKNLIVNYLPVSFREQHLAHLFCEVGELVSVRIIVDKKTKRSKGYGFVKFTTPEAAAEAIKKLNGFRLLGKNLKVAYARPGGPRARANLFVGNVPKFWTSQDLNEHFKEFGPIIESRILRNPDGESRRCGFVRLDTEAAANMAIANMDGYTPQGAYHGIHVKIAGTGITKYNNLGSEKPDARRDSYNNASNYSPNHYDNSYLEGPAPGRHLQGSVSENHKYHMSNSQKRDPTRMPVNKHLSRKQLRNVGKTMSLPLMDDELAEMYSERWRDEERGRQESDPPAPSEPIQANNSGNPRPETYQDPADSGYYGNPAVYQPYVNTFQNQPVMMPTVLPQVQTYTLAPLPGYENSISPAHTPPPYTFMATTPPYHMGSPMMSPDQNHMDFIPDQFVHHVVSPDPRSAPEPPAEPEKSVPQSKPEKPQTRPKLKSKKRSIKYKKTESEMELEELGIDTDDLPPTLPTIQEQGSFQVSITNISESKEDEEVGKVTDSLENMQASEYFDDQAALDDPEDGAGKVAAASGGDLPVATVIADDNPPTPILLDNMINQDLNLAGHLDNNQSGVIPITPPIMPVVMTSATPPPMGLSPSPMMVPVHSSTPPGIPLSHSPVVMPMATPPVTIPNSAPVIYNPEPNNYYQANQNYPINGPAQESNSMMYSNNNEVYGSRQQYEQGQMAPIPAENSGDADAKGGNHVCLFVYNLPPFFDENHIYNLFQEYGPVKYTTVHRHTDGTSKGFGFVNYYTSESARRAIKSLNGHVFFNKKLQVRYKVEK